MYTTKLLHKNIVQNNAYITIGDPYHDPLNGKEFRQSKKSDKPPFKTDQIPKNAENGNFSKTEYKSAGFQEDIKYINKQPLDLRKKGFGSRDADRRDEFSSNIRTEQYRETLRKELARTGKHSTEIEEELNKLLKLKEMETDDRVVNHANNDSSNFSYSSNVPLYDIGRTRVTQFDPRSTKDSFYRFNTVREKRIGNTKPESTVVGSGSWDVTYKPPAFGGRSEVKNFFDRSHIHVSH